MVREIDRPHPSSLITGQKKGEHGSSQDRRSFGYISPHLFRPSRVRVLCARDPRTDLQVQIKPGRRIDRS